jgi:hypothetical protein
VTNSKTRIAAYVTGAVLSLGLAGDAVSAWEIQAANPEATGAWQFLQVQDRGRPGSTFRSAPEFPPTGYLGEFDDTVQGRFDRSAQEFARDPFPPAEVSRPSRLGQDFPEYAPQAPGSRVPSSRVPGQTEPGGTGAGSSRPVWGDPAFAAPPAVGPDRRMPPADPGGTWGDFPSLPPAGGPRDRVDLPGMPTQPRHQGRAEFPHEGPQRASPGTYPGSGPEHQWPLAPSGSGYQGYPPYQPESWERTRPETPQDRFPPYRDFPRGDSYGRGR